MTRFTEAPIFDADQHMYETPDSLTKYLPEKYSRAVQFAQIGRQTRIVINNKINDFIPNPTFERVAAPGAHEKFFAGENTEGLTLREMQGPAVAAPAATRNPGDRVAELDRQGVVEALNYPTLASLIEHATADDPELTLAIVHALNQWMRPGAPSANISQSSKALNLQSHCSLAKRLRAVNLLYRMAPVANQKPRIIAATPKGHASKATRTGTGASRNSMKSSITYLTFTAAIRKIPTTATAGLNRSFDSPHVVTHVNTISASHTQVTRSRNTDIRLPS